MESMADKRKRRFEATNRKKQALEEFTATLPKSKLDFQTATTSVTTTMQQRQQEQEEIANNKSDDNSSTNSKAKQLVDAQMESVKMLSHVAERLNETLERQGGIENFFCSNEKCNYLVVDGFLSPKYCNELQQESEYLYNTDDSVIPGALGTGEFVIRLEGGEQQYPKCPRSIEFIVSMTKTLATMLNHRIAVTQQQQQQQHEPESKSKSISSNSKGNSKGNTSNITVELDDGVCAQATARIFDRSALLASLRLLLGSNNNNGNSNNDDDDDDDDDVQQQQEEEETIIEKVNSTSRPLQLLSQHDPVIDNSSSDNTTTTNNSERDLRTVSILYYLVPSEWNEECGGHLTFRRGNNDDDSDNKDDDDDDDDSNVVTVYAKRNRLVLWKSQDTVYRREPFLGKNDRNNTNNVTRASTIELHLVERKQ